MEWWPFILFIAVALTLLLGYPVAFTLGGVALLVALLASAVGAFELGLLQALPNRLFGIMTNQTLMAVPLFVFMGALLERSKVADDLLNAMSLLAGRLPGGLGLAVVLMGALMAASTGIVGATVVTMGLLALPSMLRQGYDPAFSCGVICASGTLGQIIPPSIVLELMVDLANQIGADPWFNMPHKADDAYMREFAQYVHDNLRPGLKAHVEYSNEVWNFLFEQAHWAAAEARALWGDRAEGDGWMQFYGHRSAEMATIWSDIFAEDMSRLVRVFGVHTGWGGLEAGALNAPLSVQKGGPRPADLFDAYAVTGYFGLEFSAEGFEETILKWIAEGETSGQGYQLPIERLAARVKEKGLLALTQEYWPYHAKVAADHGMQLMMYEGGTHIIGREAWVHDDTLTAFLNAFNYSPEMADIYQDLLAAWDAAGGTFFNAFVDVAKPSKWGSWGALRHLGDSNPRADVLTAYNAAGAKWASDRGADAFEAGDIIFGTDGSDILNGTQYPDVLIGGAGDDEFYPDAGKNHVHGGAGNDHVVLPGFLEEYRFAAEGPRLVASSDLGVTRLVAVETLSFSETPELILSTSDLF